MFQPSEHMVAPYKAMDCFVVFSISTFTFSPLAQCALFAWHDMMVVYSQNLPLKLPLPWQQMQVPNHIEGYV